MDAPSVKRRIPSFHPSFPLPLIGRTSRGPGLHTLNEDDVSCRVGVLTLAAAVGAHLNRDGMSRCRLRAHRNSFEVEHASTVRDLQRISASPRRHDVRSRLAADTCQGLRESQPLPEQSLPNVNMKEIPDREFQERFVGASRPVLIQHAMDGWRAWDRWSSADQLNKHYGHVKFRIGVSNPLKKRKPLSAFLQYATANTNDNSLYLFEYDFSGPRAPLLDDYVPPTYFAEGRDMYNLSEATRKLFPQPRYLIIGGMRSGTNVHIDWRSTSAWNASLCGTKRWVLFPPGIAAETIAAGPDCGRSQRAPPIDWWLDVYPRLRARGAELGMLELIQSPGEVVYVPHGWWHATLNLSSLAVAVSQNLLLPAAVPSVLPFLKRTEPAFADACEAAFFRLQDGTQYEHRVLGSAIAGNYPFLSVNDMRGGH